MLGQSRRCWPVFILSQSVLHADVPACLFSVFLTLFFSDFIYNLYIYIYNIYIYTFTVRTIFSTKKKKTRRYVRGHAKLKQFQTSQKNLDRAHNKHPPPYLIFFFGNKSPTWTENLVHVVAEDE